MIIVPVLSLGWKLKTGSVLEVLVDEEVDVMLGVVDEAERGDVEKSDKNHYIASNI